MLTDGEGDGLAVVDGEALDGAVLEDRLWGGRGCLDVGVTDELGVPVALDADDVPDLADEGWLTPHPAKMRLPTKTLMVMATCFMIDVLL